MSSAKLTPKSVVETTVSSDGQIDYKSEFFETNNDWHYNPTTINDVITIFFEEIYNFLIQRFDRVKVDKIKSEEKIPTAKTIVKHYKDITWDDLLKGDVYIINDCNVIFRQHKDDKNIDAELSYEEELPQETAGEHLNLEETKTQIIFTNGNIYEGDVVDKLMHGRGKYVWHDGTFYEGTFENGFPTGHGHMVLPDNSVYTGGFCQGLFHGKGDLIICQSNVLLYSGEWNHSKKQGSGWFLYGPNTWHNGEWYDDKAHGTGERQYADGSKYKGEWADGKQHGQGTFVWASGDVYIGNWQFGLPDGYGEYIWKVKLNNNFTFPIQEAYQGFFQEGRRHGEGILSFSKDMGGIMKGTWLRNFKHGEFLVCLGGGLWANHLLTFHTDKIVPYDPTSKIIKTPTIKFQFYLQKFLEETNININDESLGFYDDSEETNLRNMLLRIITRFEQIYNIYVKYALNSEPEMPAAMMRIFLWQFYRDINIYQFGLSLSDIDLLLLENPQSSISTVHDPFEPIYLWQFILSIIGISLSIQSYWDFVNIAPDNRVAEVAVMNFLENYIFNQDLPKGNFYYKDLLPITGVYSLYLEIGEPHTANKLFRTICQDKELDALCDQREKPKKALKIIRGFNAITLYKNVKFIETNDEEPIILQPEEVQCTSLKDFGVLGTRKILHSFLKICPLIKQEGCISNMNYPIIFLEFYEILLNLTFLFIEKKLGDEKERLLKETNELGVLSASKISTSSRKRKSKAKSITTSIK